MFLNLLNSKEKRAFLQLAHAVAHIDDDVNQIEKGLIMDYLAEMGFDNDVLEQIEKETLLIEEILLGFELSNRQVKNAVFIEIIALIQSDSVCHEKEKEIIPVLTSKLDISNSMQTEVEAWVQDMKSLYQKGNKLIQHD